MRAMRLLWTLLGARGLPEASRSKLGVVGLLYFIEGSPVSLLWEVLPVYLRVHGTSLRAIGGLRLLELPFSLKFLWSPLVQRFGEIDPTLPMTVAPWSRGSSFAVTPSMPTMAIRLPLTSEVQALRASSRL